MMQQTIKKKKTAQKHVTTLTHYVCLLVRDKTMYRVYRALFQREFSDHVTELDKTNM